MVVRKIVKRTFLAKKFPAGSAMRKKLNRNIATSEFVPGNRFAIITSFSEQGVPTRKMAEQIIRDSRNRPKFLTTSQKQKRRSKK